MITFDLLGFDPELLNLTQAIEIETYNMTEQLDNIEEYDSEDMTEQYADAVLDADEDEWNMLYADC